MLETLDNLHRSGLLAPIDFHLGLLIRRRASAAGAEEAAAEVVGVTAALLSHERGRGHSCLDLGDWAGRGFGEEGADAPAALPAVERWREALVASGVVGGDGEATPLVWGGGGRLYLRRYREAEERVARRLLARLEEPPPEPDVTRLGPAFRRLFPGAGIGEGDGGVDRQAVAAAAALRHRLAVVTGGPGTGKTTTVTRILALLLSGDPGMRIALATPTGKAAARLGESIAAQLASLPVDPELRDRLPREASTLHRLLGYLPRYDRFRHHAGRPLPVDALVIDEASMVDLLLMDAVLDALAPDARLILLGDRDQLASVETGFVFGDLCAAADLGAGVSPGFADFCRRLGAGELATVTADTDTDTGSGSGAAPPLRDAAVELEVSYRFRSQPGIGALAAAIRRGDADGALEVLADPGFADVERIDPPAAVEELLAPILGELDHCLAAGSPAEALERLGRFRILGATRRGVLGIERLNAAVERHLLRRGLPAAEPWYRGRPLLVTANDYQVRLYNGDLGVAWPDGVRAVDGPDGRLHAWFRDGEGLRRLPLAKLPAHETAWAMTVHKSQGSELDRVLLVLPVADSAVLTRELLYTGLTRARRRVHLVATPEAVRRAVERPSRRRSGLASALRTASEPEAPSKPPSDPEPPETPSSGQLSLF